MIKPDIKRIFFKKKFFETQWRGERECMMECWVRNRMPRHDAVSRFPLRRVESQSTGTGPPEEAYRLDHARLGASTIRSVLAVCLVGSLGGIHPSSSSIHVKMARISEHPIPMNTCLHAFVYKLVFSGIFYSGCTLAVRSVEGI